MDAELNSKNRIIESLQQELIENDQVVNDFVNLSIKGEKLIGKLSDFRDTTEAKCTTLCNERIVLLREHAELLNKYIELQDKNNELLCKFQVFMNRYNKLRISKDLPEQLNVDKCERCDLVYKHLLEEAAANIDLTNALEMASTKQSNEKSLHEITIKTQQKEIEYLNNQLNLIDPATPISYYITRIMALETKLANINSK